MLSALQSSRSPRLPRIAHAPRLKSLDDWAALAARPEQRTTARCEAVKVVVDLFDASRTYFFDSKRWNTHYRFIQRFIDPRVDHDLLLKREYTSDSRRFLLATVLHYLDGEHWTLELTSGDTLSAERIAGLFEHISRRIDFPCPLWFRPVSPCQIAQATMLGGRIPVLSRDAINADVVYQPVVLGVAYGRLRRVRGRLDMASLHPYDIVVTDEVPIEIPPIAALITSQLQAPLMHVAVLSRNRNTPDMACRGAIDSTVFTALEGQLVKLNVAAQDFTIEPADPVHAEAAWAGMRPSAVLTPHLDRTVHEIHSVNALPDAAATCVGAKAAQIGVLGAIDGIVTPGGFALPFAAYCAHLEAAGLVMRIDAMLRDPSFRADARVRADRLAELRAAIQLHPVEATLLARLEQAMRAAGIDKPWLFRSSSNAEDLPGFSGAGLYESMPVPADPSPRQIAEALRSVWASVWLQRAFEEREWYRIDHRNVAMAVLAQPYLDTALASGVAITGNPFQREAAGAFINVQARGHSVTGAVGNELPEQILVTTWSGDYEFELLSRSSLTQGANILGEDDLRRLCSQLARIHDTMLPRARGGANAMDVEFILTTAREFVIVQARPYTIVHGVDDSADNSHEGRWDAFMRTARRVAFRFLPNRLAYRPAG